MDKPRFPDKYDWRGCEAVQFNPLKMGGRATVEDMRMDADSVLDNCEDGMSVEDDTNHRPTLVREIEPILEAIQRSYAGSFEEVRIPKSRSRSRRAE